MSNLKNFFRKPINVIIFITCAVIIVYFCMLIIKEIGIKSYNEKQMECLRLGSDFARRRCLLILENQNTKIQKDSPCTGRYCDLIPNK